MEFSHSGLWAMSVIMIVIASFEKKVSIKSVDGTGTGLATNLWVNGNPSKFLQGHATYNRHRLELKEHGINIDLRPESTQKSNLMLYRLKWHS